MEVWEVEPIECSVSQESLKQQHPECTLLQLILRATLHQPQKPQTVSEDALPVVQVNISVPLSQMKTEADRRCSGNVPALLIKT